MCNNEKELYVPNLFCAFLGGDLVHLVSCLCIKFEITECIEIFLRLKIKLIENTR